MIANLYIFYCSHGYLASFINPYQGNNLCAFNKLDVGDIEFDKNLVLNKKQLCSNTFKSGYEQVYLEKEFYQITLKLIFPDLPENYKLGK